MNSHRILLGLLICCGIATAEQTSQQQGSHLPGTAEQRIESEARPPAVDLINSDGLLSEPTVRDWAARFRALEDEVKDAKGRSRYYLFGRSQSDEDRKKYAAGIKTFEEKRTLAEAVGFAIELQSKMYERTDRLTSLYEELLKETNERLKSVKRSKKSNQEQRETELLAAKKELQDALEMFNGKRLKAKDRDRSDFGLRQILTEDKSEFDRSFAATKGDPRSNLADAQATARGYSNWLRYLETFDRVQRGAGPDEELDAPVAQGKTP